MKTLISSLLAISLPLCAHAKIDVTSRVSVGNSYGREATQLLQTLKRLGLKSRNVGGVASEELNVRGSVTITNGAACDNGRQTFNVTLEALDEKNAPMQTLELDGSAECTSQSRAERFTKLLDVWGGKTLELDCGLGHCWEKINSINCTHYPKDGTRAAYDNCTVELSSGQ